MLIIAVLFLLNCPKSMQFCVPTATRIWQFAVNWMWVLVVRSRQYTNCRSLKRNLFFTLEYCRNWLKPVLGTWIRIRMDPDLFYLLRILKELLQFAVQFFAKESNWNQSSSKLRLIWEPDFASMDALLRADFYMGKGFALETLTTELQRAPDWDSFHLQFFPAKQHLHESGLPERSYAKSCGKSNSSALLTE
jgi:hypothetical protein